jgi:hypothetical protein
MKFETEKSSERRALGMSACIEPSVYSTPSISKATTRPGESFDSSFVGRKISGSAQLAMTAERTSTCGVEM